MTVAYGSKTCKVPLTIIAKILRYPSLELATGDLYTIGAQIFEDDASKEKFARFSKPNSSLCKQKVIIYAVIIPFHCFRISYYSPVSK